MTEKRENQKPEYLSAPALAVRLGVSRSQIYKLLRAGKLPEPLRVGSLMRWPMKQIDDWVAEGRAA